MILTLCPTKNNPDAALSMVKSFKRTASKDNKIILIFSSDDKCFEQYSEARSLSDMVHIYPKGKTVTELINESASIGYDLYQFYHVTNDDVIYRTKGWDQKFIDKAKEEGDGIFYGNDLLQGSNLPTFPFISYSIVRALGYVQNPMLDRYYADTIWKLIGLECNCLHYLEDVIIEHRHTYDGDASDIKNLTVNSPMYTKDKLAFAEWLRVAQIDIKKVKDAIVLNSVKR